MTGSATPSISAKPIQLHKGEPTVYFSAMENREMAEPFKLALVGKFFFGHPLIDIIQNFFLFLWG